MTEPATLVAPAVVAVTTKAPAEISLAGEAMLWLGVVFLLFLIYVFVRAQLDRHNRVDLTDLLIAPETGKITPGRFWALVGGAAGTFVFIFLAVSGHFDATYASAYLLAAFGLKVAGDITGKPTPGAGSEVTTTTSTIRAGASMPAVDQVALVDAGRGVEPLSPKIKPADVGKTVALVSRPKRKKRKPTKGAAQ